MSVATVSSALSSNTSLLALLGSSSTSASGSSAAVATSATGDAVTVDLSDIAKAAAAGDSATKSAAVAQLKADLGSEQSALLSSLDGLSTSAADVGDQLLSSIYGSSSLGSLASQSNGATGTTLDTTA